MVATDVASRGIGMIQLPNLLPLSPLAIPGRLLCSALLSTPRRLLDCVNCLGSFLFSGYIF
jgi:hypothetical protein